MLKYPLGILFERSAPFCSPPLSRHTRAVHHLRRFRECSNTRKIRRTVIVAVSVHFCIHQNFKNTCQGPRVPSVLVIRLKIKIHDGDSARRSTKRVCAYTLITSTPHDILGIDITNIYYLGELFSRNVVAKIVCAELKWSAYTHFFFAMKKRPVVNFRRLL